MQKIYLLLRSNKQTGPYTFEELLQLNLKPFDLVWVDGRSAAWQYPFEIPALKPYVPETPQAAIPFQPVATDVLDRKPDYTSSSTPAANKTTLSGRIFVSVPKTYHQQQQYAQENAGSFAPTAAKTTSPPPAPEPEPLRTNYARPLQEVEEDYASWIYRQKTQRKVSLSQRDFVVAALIVAMIGSSYYLISKPSVTNKILPSHQPAARVLEQAPAQTPERTEEEMAVTTAPVPVLKDVKDHHPPAQKKIAKNPANVAANQTVRPTTAENTIPVEKTTSNISSAEEPAAETVSSTKSGTGPAKVKKKKFGDVIKGLFAKKNENKTENSQVVVETPPSANNRRATRRDEAESTASTEAAIPEILPDEVELYSNHTDNWMMGVRDLNITLRNHSHVGIQTALVYVKYYDENNRLLDKKTIRFENVAANGRSTVAAPENKWADHAGFELASVTAKDDRYASHQ